MNGTKDPASALAIFATFLSRALDAYQGKKVQGPEDEREEERLFLVVSLRIKRRQVKGLTKDKVAPRIPVNTNLLTGVGQV